MVASRYATWNTGFVQRLLDLSLSPSSTTLKIAGQARNVAGLVTSRHTDVTGSPMTFVESKWTYDKLGRVASQLVQEGPGPTQVARQDLAYFGNDDPKSLDHWLGASNHKHYDYGFDLRHQLTSVGESQLPNAFTATYTYNAAGRFATANEAAAALPNSDVRPRNVTYTYNGVDPEEVTSLTNVSGGATAWAYTYDLAGNQTMRCSGAIVSNSCTGTDETDYIYDGDDHLRRATRKLSGAVSGSEEYWYDGRGNRNIVVKRDATGSKTETIWLINDVEAHYDGAGSWVHSYAHISMGTPVARVDTGTNQLGIVEYQFHGLANNMLAAIDQSTGTINASFNYAPFGEVVEATDAGGTSGGVGAHRRRMNDKFVDSTTDLAYYGFRYYDKVSMTWTQADPMYRFAPDSAWAMPRKASLYTNDLNNPLRYMDPDGRWIASLVGGLIDVGEGIGAGAVALAAAPFVIIGGTIIVIATDTYHDPGVPVDVGCGTYCDDAPLPITAGRLTNRHAEPTPSPEPQPDPTSTAEPVPDPQDTAAHRKNKRESNREKHENPRPGGPERADPKRQWPRNRPNWYPKKGPYPPNTPYPQVPKKTNNSAGATGSASSTTDSGDNSSGWTDDDESKWMTDENNKGSIE